MVLRRTNNGGMLVVGQSLEPEQTALHTLVVVLVGGGGIGLLLSLAAAWFLSGRALIPIQQAFERQQEFVADASHELRTPLTVLRSATDLLNQHRDEPLENNGELFDDVRAEIARMERLAQDLLTLARSDTGGLELMTAPVDIADVAAEVVRRTTPLAQSDGVQLTLQAAEAQPATVEADPDRMQQVLLILIDNAIKHTPAGGSVEVRVQRHGQTAQVRSRRHRQRDRGGASAADLRSLLPRRQGSSARPGRHRSRAGHRQDAGRSPRRPAAAQQHGRCRHAGDGFAAAGGCAGDAGRPAGRVRGASATLRISASKLRGVTSTPAAAV